MKTKYSLKLIALLITFGGSCIGISAAPLGTAFIYQGRLNDGASPATGLYDLRFARMSGRVGMAKALLVSILDIKLMLTVKEGQLALIKRVRSQAQAMRALVETFTEEMGGFPAQVAVIHAQAPQAAEQLRAAIAEQIGATRIFVQDLSLGVAVHFGPGTVGLVGYNP